jgi:hypothetical protein
MVVVGRDTTLGIARRQTVLGHAKPEQGRWGRAPNPIEGGAGSGALGTNGSCPLNYYNKYSILKYLN